MASEGEQSRVETIFTSDDEIIQKITVNDELAVKDDLAHVPLDSAENQMSDVERQNVKLRRKIEQLEEDLRLAAEIGKQLLGNNHDLSQQLETSTRDLTSQIETLEQERHELQLKLEHNIQEGKYLAEELEYVKTKYESQKRDFEFREKNDHMTLMNQLKKQIATLQAEMEVATLMTSQVEQKHREATELAESLQRDLNEKMNSLNETCSDEMAQLHSDISSLTMEKRELTSQLGDSKRENEQLRLALTKAKTDVDTREAEVEEQQCQATAYFNALERSREEVQELKVQLDIIRMETQDQKRKGNSLFAEVEDRRVEAEKKMISLKVQNETLKKQYSMMKENLHNLKLQMATLLQMSTGRADARHVSRLEEQLDEARHDLAELTRKMGAQKRVESSAELVSTWEQILNQHGKQDYASFVKVLLKNKDDEVDRLDRELKILRLQDMARTQQVQDYEKQIYSMEQEKERLVGLTMKQRVRIDELLIKYEPDKQRASQKSTFRAEKLPPRAPPVENKENQPKPPPRPLQAPEHIKSALHQEVIQDTVPTADPDTTIEQHLANMSTVAETKPTPSLQMLRSKTKKKVTLNSEVEVREIDTEKSEGVTEGAGQGSAKIKGGKVAVNKTVKIKAAPPPGPDGPDCKVQ